MLRWCWRNIQLLSKSLNTLWKSNAKKSIFKAHYEQYFIDNYLFNSHFQFTIRRYNLMKV
jgi:hypothetical protein